MILTIPVLVLVLQWGYGNVTTVVKVLIGKRETAGLTYMTCYQVEFVFWLVEHFAGLAHEVEIACAVKAILADCMLLIQLIRQSVHVGMRSHTLVESCVKDCNLQTTHYVAVSEQYNPHHKHRFYGLRACTDNELKAFAAAACLSKISDAVIQTSAC